MESNHHSARRRGYSPLSSPVLSVREGGVAGRARTGAAGITTPDASVYTTATTERGRPDSTDGLSPDKRSLFSSELRPRSSAGGIRTHGLELMRLARTASPLPRKSGWQESNLRSPAPEAGGVASLPYSQLIESPRRESNPQLPG